MRKGAALFQVQKHGSACPPGPLPDLDGERRLAAAVIGLALTDLAEAPLYADGRDRPYLAARAEAFFRGDLGRWWCRLAGLDPRALQERLSRCSGDQLGEAARALRNMRMAGPEREGNLG